MILSAQSIRARVGMIEPFCNRSVSQGMSYGLSAAGYDIRLAQDVWLWPYWGRLASSMERFDLPSDVVGLAVNKSSWARRFVCSLITPLEPGWRGYLTVELVRFLPWPLKVKAGTPIAQILFVKLDQPTAQPYAGKYQDQAAGPQPAREEQS